jgi:hypothetical protein
MVLHRRGDEEPNEWKKVIEGNLLTRAGRPSTLVRTVTDHYKKGDKPSLRP